MRLALFGTTVESNGGIQPDEISVSLFGRVSPLVPIGASALIASKIVKGAALKIYPGAPHGLTATHRDQFNADLLAFIKTQLAGSATPGSR